MKLLFSGLILLSLISCSDIAKSDQLSRISGMETSLDSIETILNTHKIDTLQSWILSCYLVEKRIKENYVSDTINMELGKKMDAYKVMRRSLEPIGTAMSSLQKGVTEEREKLSLLKEDIDNGNGDREKYDEFVQFEENKLRQLRLLTTEIVDTQNSAIEKYNLLHDELNAFSLSLLNTEK